MSGEDVHVAVAHEQGGGGVCVQILHQAEHAGGVRLGGHPGAAAPHDEEPLLAEVVGNDPAAQGVGLVGKDGAPDAEAVQGVHQRGNAGVRRCFIFFMGIVPGRELGQRGGQLLRAAAVGGGEPLHQFGDAVAHHVLELLHREGGPAVLCADPVPGIGQIVDGVQQGAVQIE